MSNMLSTGVSGLLAFQTALDTVSHNVSNSATTGYSRETTTLTSSTGSNEGGYWIGNGVSVSSVERVYDDIVAGQVRNASSSKSRWDTYSSLASQIDDMLGDSDTGIAASLQNLVDDFQSIANSPSSTSERQVALSDAESLVSQLRSYDATLDDLTDQVNTQLDSEITTINGLAQSIAQLNAQIAAATGSGGSAPNDLLDQRDNLIDELSTHIGVSTVKQDDGQVNVFIGSGQALVSGTSVATLSTRADEFDASKQVVTVTTSSGSVDISDSLTGGTVGGLLSFRDEILDPAKNTLGQIAVALADVINSQQNAGMDLNGELGSDLFTIGGVQVQDSVNNTGSGTVSVTRSDVSELTTSDYLLTRTSSGWTLQRTDTGETVTMTGSGTASNPFVADGLSIVVNGSAATGDKYMINPTSAAVSGMSVAITDTDGIAAAAPIATSADGSNTGNATISSGTVVDADNANLLDTVTIEFLSATTYTTDGGTTISNYTSGQSITVNGWEVTLSGTPATGDTFTVAANTNGTGDNRNAQLLANALDKGLLEGGTKSINDTISSWVSGVGVKVSQAQANYSTQSTVYDDAYNTQQSISGVNTDEEAAALLRYEQAYAAAAKVISTASELFDTLLDAIG